VVLDVQQIDVPALPDPLLEVVICPF
jgi:hypothetical protein